MRADNVLLFFCLHGLSLKTPADYNKTSYWMSVLQVGRSSWSKTDQRQ